MYPNMFILLQILQTLPITTAQAERFFSKMERLFTAIRATVEEDRLKAFLILQIHREDTPTIDEVIDRFSAVFARRLKFAV